MVLARRLLMMCVFLALLVCGWYFASLNSAPVVISHPGGDLGEYKLWVALTGSFAFGVALSASIAMYRGARMRLASRRYRKMLAGLQSEIHQLRSLPLADAAANEDAGVRADALERGS